MHEEDAEELDAGDDSGEYKVEAIWDSAVYVRESESGHLPSLYYLVSWKGIQRKRITGSQPQRSSTLNSSLSGSIRTTLTNRRRLLLQWIPYHRWLDPPNLSSENEDNQQDALRSASRRANRCTKRSDKEEAIRRNPSQYDSKEPEAGG